MDRRIESASRISQAQFDKFMPLLLDLRLEKRGSILSIVIISFRRLILLFMAFFVIRKPWLQVMSFMLLSFISLSFMLVVRPYNSAIINNSNIFNEFFSLLASYFLLELQDFRYEPDDMLTIGEATHNLFITWAIIDVLVIIGAMLLNVFAMLKRWYQRRKKLK